VSCEEQRILKNLAEQERLNEQLATSSGYKKYPSCGVMIEKTEGCKRMTFKCGAHICWKCMNVFETPEETYGHLRAAYGGIYEEAPAGIVVGDAWNPDFLVEQVGALARFERERVAREPVLRRPMAGAANPFVGQNQNAEYRAQRMADQLRRVGGGAPAACIAVINRRIFAEEEPRQLRERKSAVGVS